MGGINSRVEIVAWLLVDNPRRPVHYLYDDFEVAAGHAGHGSVKLEFALIARAEKLGAGEVHDALAGGMRFGDQHEQEVPCNMRYFVTSHFDSELRASKKGAHAENIAGER